MCGITGFFSVNRSVDPRLYPAVIGRMRDTLIHRGPDDAGEWHDPDAGICLGHRRLSIIDLSAEGKQPMLSHSGRYAAVLNGEIYNFRQLRAEIGKGSAPPSWRGRSDTEVMLAAFDRWGIESSLGRFNGMFAIAVFDREKRELYLIRDRIGKKPLYYGWSKGSLVFGSELKSVVLFPDFPRRIDRGALALFFRYNYIPAPYSVYEGVRKLEPSSFVRISRDGTTRGGRYWSLAKTAELGLSDPFTGDEKDAVSALDALIRQAVGERMVSDVPLGAFLSGGIDSSTVVAVMAAISPRPVKTFSIGMHEQGYNEAESAKTVARHLGTDHTEFYITPSDALAVIPRLPEMFDEPFSDSSQIPTFLVSELTRRHVTVCLSGDGGDELFCGYNRYFLSRKLWRSISWMPLSFRKRVGKLMTLPSVEQWERFSRFGSRFLKDYGQQGTFGDKFHKIASVLEMTSPDDIYLRLVTHWERPETLVTGAVEPAGFLNDGSSLPGIKDYTRRMMFFDLMTCLPDDIMTKVDRATMAVGLEARAPFLDQKLVEFSWRLPLSLMLRDNRGKYVLRKVLEKYVPPELTDRPKWGFGIPVGKWLSGELREWTESLIAEERLRREGYLDPAPIRRIWEEHLSGRRNWQFLLWDVLMFQSWKERWA